MSLVEYHDPDGVFPLLAPSLSSHLPLKNLYWKSPFRPLRSIDSLHVDFLPSKSVRSSYKTESVASLTDRTDAENHKPRRHQIPGLRSTPFLKIYLLRCDDKDVYKASKRKLLRDWVKENTNGPQNVGSASKQENHDACEWLILHVVLPGTVAASQLRFSKRTSGDSETLKERSSGTKWPGRGPRPILEKLRADFNEQSKHVIDRVAQIRLRKEELPIDLHVAVPDTPLASVVETPQEYDSAWNDLISKLKTMILASFDRRVTQYEEDVREKDAQRNLPGWNFCTFFVLKEGLAMAFESVGLLEDALAGYDELALGLESSIRNKNGENENGEATTFLEFTLQLQQYLMSGHASSVPHITSKDGSPLSKPSTWSSQEYRELIASNQISVFDFHRYIFSRQMSLLLLLAGIRPSPLDSMPKSQPTTSSDEASSTVEDNPHYLAELGYRATQFITSTARIMKSDMYLGAASSSHDGQMDEFTISLIVSAWIYAVAQEVLDASLGPSVPKLPKFTETRRKKSSGRTEPSSKRRSSQTTLQSKVLSSISENKEEETQTSILNLEDVTVLENHSLANACAQRAELHLLQRRLLSRLVGSSKLESRYRPRNGHEGSMDEGEEEEDAKDRVAEDDSGTADDEQQSALLNMVFGFSPRLSQSLSSLSDSQRLYEVLSEASAWYYILAGRAKSAHRIITDLANLKFGQNDFAAAATYFNKALMTSGEDQWSVADTDSLYKYSQCLKALNRKDEYIRTVLTLLAKMATNNKLCPHNASENSSATTLARSMPTTQARRIPDMDILFEDIVSYSRSLSYDISVPLTKYFDNLEIDTFIHNSDDSDSFELGLSLQQLLASEIVVEIIKARLISTEDGPPTEFWLSNDNSVTMGDGCSSVKLSAPVTTVGRYMVDRLVIQAGKLAFTYEPLARQDVSLALSLSGITSVNVPSYSKTPWVLCYPRPDAFSVTVSPSSHASSSGPKKLTIELDAGSNEVDSAEVLLRPGSGDLRLYITETEGYGDTKSKLDLTKPGTIGIGPVSAYTSSRISVPYTIDGNPSNITVRLEVQYSVRKVNYTLLQTYTVSNNVLVGVTVENLFHRHHLISKFLLTPTSSIPLRVRGASLLGPEHFNTRIGASNFVTTVASQEQPASVAFVINHHSESTSKVQAGACRRMVFSMDYHAVDDEVVYRAAKVFETHLQTSKFRALSKLLSESFIFKLKAYLSPTIYEEIALTSQIYLPSAEAFGWADILEGMPTDMAGGLGPWLELWHKENPMLKVEDIEESSAARIKHFSVSLDVPHLDYLFTASFQLPDVVATSSSVPLFALGETLAVKVVIDFTTAWAARLDEDQIPYTIERLTYEIYADTQRWLICGPKRGSFSSKENEKSEFDVFLIPLRSGLSLLPTVEVRLADPDTTTSYKTNYVSRSQSIMVIEGMQSTTVGLGNGDQLQPKIRLLEAERWSLLDDH